MNTTILVTLVTLSMAAISRTREVRDDVFSVIESDVSITEEIRDETEEMREEIEEQGGGLVDHDDAQLEWATPACWRFGTSCICERSFDNAMQC